MHKIFLLVTRLKTEQHSTSLRNLSGMLGKSLWLVSYAWVSMSTSWCLLRLEASSTKYKIAGRVGIFSREVLFPKLLELFPADAAFALLKIEVHQNLD